MQVLLVDIQNISKILRSRTIPSGLKAKCRFGRLGQQGLESRETVEMAFHVQAALFQHLHESTQKHIENSTV